MTLSFKNSFIEFHNYFIIQAHNKVLICVYKSHIKKVFGSQYSEIIYSKYIFYEFSRERLEKIIGLLEPCLIPYCANVIEIVLFFQELPQFLQDLVIRSFF